ncbi:DUF397 domain-containing protein [Actinomadura logoneensis]|uniref:DUF397 domain-containing protein n=1 Tax=Actinomadura logoneensis TaxID=2293572 RepID=A0A372JI24_9ACTN|nr:DUF397 domain-containing protein [Actinomadura logoneensis]RFU39504.1 DUF397 domain-containing protein [Actinomadura logoneensis]
MRGAAPGWAAHCAKASVDGSRRCRSSAWGGRVTVQWRKSSYSGTATDEVCVELGRLERGVGLRDSKMPSIGHLSLTEGKFGGLVASIKGLRADHSV